MLCNECANFMMGAEWNGDDEPLTPYVACRNKHVLDQFPNFCRKQKCKWFKKK